MSTATTTINTTTNQKKRRIPISLWWLFIVQVFSFTISAHQQEEDKEANIEYGVDCSFPIHTLEFRDKTDVRCHEVSFGEDRTSVYQAFMEGCRAQYGERCDLTEHQRVNQMLRQVPSLRNYTSTGFAKTRAPTELFDLIHQHWLRNMQSSTNDPSSQGKVDMERLNHPERVEAWTKGHTYVNYWTQNTSYFGMDNPETFGSWQLHDRIMHLTQPLLEEWTGMELRPTSLYGIRVYRKGAILSPHVDRNPLIASAIINVAQDPTMTEDWPLEVIDRRGKATNISMVPGDMIFYESGTLIHGRPFALLGSYYANVFVHFEPTGRKLKHVHNEDMMYDSENNPAGYRNGILLPPYISPDSGEALDFINYNPHGWEIEVDEDEDEDDFDDGDDEWYSTSDDYSYSESDDYSYGESDDEDEASLDREDSTSGEETGIIERSDDVNAPSCPLLDDWNPAQSLSATECRKAKIPLHKKILSQINQTRKNLVRLAQLSQSTVI